MRGMLMGVAMFLGALAATPAAAQNEGQLPTWSAGRWCGELRPEVLQCVTYTMGDGVMTSSTELVDHGEVQGRSESRTIIENGRLTKRTPARGTAFREVSQRPGELVMENIVPANVEKGDAMRITYRVEGDELAVTFEFKDEAPTVQRYRRAD